LVEGGLYIPKTKGVECKARRVDYDQRCELLGGDNVQSWQLNMMREERCKMEEKDGGHGLYEHERIVRFGVEFSTALFTKTIWNELDDHSAQTSRKNLPRGRLPCRTQHGGHLHTDGHFEDDLSGFMNRGGEGVFGA